MSKENLLNLIREIQKQFPEKLVEYKCWNKIDETNIGELIARSLVAFPPVFLPIFEYNGDIIVVLLYPGKDWKEGAWMKLVHDMENPSFIGSSFKFMPYGLLANPYCNDDEDVEEMWESIDCMLQVNKDTPTPDKSIVKDSLDETTQFLAKYDKSNIPALLKIATKGIYDVEDAKNAIESFYKNYPDHPLSIAAFSFTCDYFKETSNSTAVLVLKENINFSYYGMMWMDSSDSIIQILEGMRVIALKHIVPESPFNMLKDSPYTEPETANKLKEVAQKFAEQGDHKTALNQIRNAMWVLGPYNITKEWCLKLAQYSDKIEKDSIASQLAYYAAEVIHLGA
jgi:hypothetical protein